VQEGFLRFVDVCFDRTADTLYEFVVRVAPSYNFECKIVSQIYVEVFVMSENIGGLQLKIEEKYHNDLFA
jgi:hypothetical protein